MMRLGVGLQRSSAWHWARQQVNQALALLFNARLPRHGFPGSGRRARKTQTCVTDRNRFFAVLSLWAQIPPDKRTPIASETDNVLLQAPVVKITPSRPGRRAHSYTAPPAVVMAPRLTQRECRHIGGQILMNSYIQGAMWHYDPA